MTPLEIRSANRSARLTLEPGRRHAFSAVLVDDPLSARVTVAHVGGGLDLDQYFAGMAVEWRGWKGSKVWESTAREIRLEAVADGKGHVLLTVTLQSGWLSSSGWQAQANIVIEAGQLDRLAEDARAFCHSVGAAA